MKCVTALAVVFLAQTLTAQTIQIDCGYATSNYVAADGTTWVTDEYSTGGDGLYTGAQVLGTPDSTLYRTARYGLYSNFGYKIPVANGSYAVTLKFAEIKYSAAGQRVFNVTVNGAPVLTNFDILAHTAPNTALDETFPVTVSNSLIDIEFVGVVNLGIINAIQVKPAVAAPVLTMSPGSLSFSGAVGTTIASQTLNIGSSGSAMNWSVSGVPSWLTLTNNGQTPSVITVTPNPASFTAAGTWNATLLFSAAGASNSPVSVPVSLTLTAAPTLTMSPGSLSFPGTVGTTIASKALNIGSSGSAMSWSVGGVPSWLTLTESGQTPSVVTVTPNLASITAAGTWNATLLFSAAGASNSPVSVPVSLTLTAAPLTMSPGSLSFSGAVGTTIASQTLNIGSSGSTMNWSVSGVPSWLTLTEGGQTTPAVITVKPNPASFTAAGTWNATLLFSAAGASNSPVSVPVSLTLTAAASSGTSTFQIDSGFRTTSYTGSDGTVWQTDADFNSGDGLDTSAGISGTTDPALYQTARYGLYSNFSYQFPVSNGTYYVTLKFAEIKYSAAGQRVFNVTINGTPVLTNFDILAHTAPFTALDETFPVTVSGNQINIQFIGVVNMGIVNAIKISGTAPSAPAPPPTLSISAPATSVTSGQSLQFSVAESGGNEAPEVAWSAAQGSISSEGLFTPPAVSTSTSIIISAQTMSAPTLEAQTTVTVNPAAAAAPPSQQSLTGVSSTGTVPTITGTSIVSGSVDNTSLTVMVTTTSPTAWIEVEYGIATGKYPYNTKSLQPAQAGSNYQATLSLGGLIAGTTYYIRATARPDPDDHNNICNASACGSTEITATTVANTSVEQPIPPNTWSGFGFPNTSSGYYTIPIHVVNSTTGECGAYATVTSPGYWTVHSGDTLTTILSEIGYGAILSFDQGVSCIVPCNSPRTGCSGYGLPALPMDPNADGNINSPSHRWIIFETAQVNNGDFPPFGARITPAWSNRLAKFYIQGPELPVYPAGQIFAAENGTDAVHHFWFANMEMAPLPTYTNPAGAVDPDAFGYFFRVGSNYQLQNNAYLVMDRLYMHGWPPPIRTSQAVELGGNYMAMVGNYISNVETWRMTAWPLYAITLGAGNTSLSIPQENYRFQATSPMLGMSGPATFTINASAGYSGQIIVNLYSSYVEVQYTTPSGSGTASVTCNGCTATATSSPATPVSAFQLLSGSVAGGQISIGNENVNCEMCTSQYAMAVGIQYSAGQGPMGPYLIDNNFVEAVGMDHYIDPYGGNYANNDLTFTHNHLIWPKNYFQQGQAWGSAGWRFEPRQHWEAKRGQRFNLTGNVFSYSWSYQNDGPSIFISGQGGYNANPDQAGLSDITVRSNIIRHGRAGIDCAGLPPLDNSSANSDGIVTTRVSITNNLMYDLGRDLYCDPLGCPGSESQYFLVRPGCQNVTIKNNTGGIMKGWIPAWMFIGGGTQLGGMLDFENNILYLSAGADPGSPNLFYSGILGDWPGPSTGYTIDPVTPAPVYGASQAMNSSMQPAINYKSFLDTTWIGAGSTVATGQYTWKNNIGIGGYMGAAGQYVDLNGSQVSTLASYMPPGDVYVPGDTIAEREAAINFADPANWNYQITAPSAYTTGGQGVDYSQLYSDAGYVTGVQPVTVVTSGVRATAQFAYTAPDSRSCSVDVSPDGLTWSRTADSGGAQARVVSVTSLSASTTYQYRILCYFEQVNDGVFYTEYTPDQITDGTFTTLAAGALQASVQYEALAWRSF